MKYVDPHVEYGGLEDLTYVDHANEKNTVANKKSTIVNDEPINLLDDLDGVGQFEVPSVRPKPVLTCLWKRENKFVTSSFITKRWKKEIFGNSNWTMNEFREKVGTDEHVGITKRQAYKALSMAKSELKRELEDNFKRIWSYCMEIQKTNPKTTCVVKLSNLTYEGGKRRFLRM